ncbi:MAG: hypothetical protein Q8P05_01455 [Candidatus Diapherotrites archaeon]|nr:hypothetical protein [Candidatus Diapherotrites archaeon]MDZ4256228.1 hypothetical protein [archaeon]
MADKGPDKMFSEEWFSGTLEGRKLKLALKLTTGLRILIFDAYKIVDKYTVDRKVPTIREIEMNLTSRDLAILRRKRVISDSRLMRYYSINRKPPKPSQGRKPLQGPKPHQGPGSRKRPGR